MKVYYWLHFDHGNKRNKLKFRDYSEALEIAERIEDKNPEIERIESSIVWSVKHNDI